ncbi:hypothetical protein [Streptomyces sp. NBC_01237]|uniref:hypothetical protein n=1 Tax=Streptomyces sp. NBC_01237 TaxID=2903790 RepID=UPI002DDAD2AE|nr:hypothetical protein [Streptomyces sp. NBC_01237]WRZ73041.1 hypothetical protein OG251_16165 [Streptomyces sp. NBC_01237]
MVLDIESFSTRSDPVQRSLRGAMYQALETALKRSGVPTADISFEDRGDGVLMIVSGAVPPAGLVGPFVRELDEELTEYARVFSEEHALRCRLALHQGLVTEDPQGWSGDAVNTACRLVDAGPLREVLTAAASARMVFVVSDEIYRGLVRHAHRGIDPAAYLPMPFADKHGRTIESWVTVPGLPAPPGLSARPAAGPERRATAGLPPEHRPPVPRAVDAGAPAPTVSVVAGVVHGDQFTGNKTVTYGTTSPERR